MSYTFFFFLMCWWPQGQGHIEGLHYPNMAVSTISSEVYFACSLCSSLHNRNMAVSAMSSEVCFTRSLCSSSRPGG